LVVKDQFTRRIVGFGVQAVAIDGPALCRMFNQAISGQGLPTRLSTDHDPLFRFRRWQANLRILGVETVQTVPQVPWSHPFIERFTATIRREYLDRLFFGLQMTWNESWSCSNTTTTRLAQVTGKCIVEARESNSELPKVGDWVAVKLVPNEEKP
jgi:transposase InsO family protein